MATMQVGITILCSVLASSGFWAYVMKKCDCKKTENDMLIGLGHDRIIYLGLKYIDRKYITQDEYENLNDYLYKPYKALGGNGSAERIMLEVNKLEIRKNGDYSK